MDGVRSVVEARVQAEYAATHARLGDDPTYQRLVRNADAEAQHTPLSYFARNSLALYVETHMPPISGGRGVPISTDSRPRPLLRQ